MAKSFEEIWLLVNDSYRAIDAIAKSVVKMNKSEKEVQSFNYIKEKLKTDIKELCDENERLNRYVKVLIKANYDLPESKEQNDG